MLDLILQLGPCRIEPVGRRLLRVRGGSDQPEVVAAIRRAGGERDGTRQFWWLEARNLRAFVDELRRTADPLFSARPEPTFAVAMLRRYPRPKSRSSQIDDSRIEAASESHAAAGTTQDTTS